MNDRTHRAVAIAGALRSDALARQGFGRSPAALCMAGRAPESRGRMPFAVHLDDRTSQSRWRVAFAVHLIGRAPQSRGRVAGSASLRRSTLRVDCPALLAARSRRGTRFVRCAHCAQTAATSQMTKRALRARRPPGCAARRRRGAPPATRPRLCAEPAVALADGPRCFAQRCGWSAGAAPLRRRAAQARGRRVRSTRIVI